MRFAWLRTRAGLGDLSPLSTVGRMLMIGYNVVWWVPAILPLLGTISYRAGFAGFLAITLFRAAVNLYRNNVLSAESAQRFPLRSP